MATTDAGPAHRRLLLGTFAFALVLRLGLVWSVQDVGLRITDERHYAAIASNLVQGHGFGHEPGLLTSMRPPLFPFFVSAVWMVSAVGDLTAVRLAHVPLSLLSVGLVYLVGRHLFSPRVGLLAAMGLAFYPSLLFSGVLVLSETLFLCLLLLTIFSAVLLLERRSPWRAIAAGACLGAAALTRSIMWPFIAPLAIAALVGLDGPWRARLRIALLLVLGYATIVGPWSLRNTLLQQSFTVVDTMGGLNLLMGNYAHTPEDRMWDAISLTGDKAWYRDLPPLAPDGSRWTEGTKDKWAQAQAFAYMKAHPLTTLRRSVLKVADFWGLERDFLAGVEHRLYQPPAWLWVTVGLSIGISYLALMVLSIQGICLARYANWRAHAVLLSVVLFMSGMHALAFGHARYHLPLVPILCVYAAAAVDGRLWRANWRSRGGAAAAILLVAVAAVWMRDLFFRDATRLAALGEFLGVSR